MKLKLWLSMIFAGLLLVRPAFAEDQNPTKATPEKPKVTVEEQSFANAMTTSNASMASLRSCIDNAIQASRANNEQAVIYSDSVKNQIARLEATVKNLTDQLNAIKGEPKEEEKK